MAVFAQYDYLFAVGTIFAFLDAWNIGANDVANAMGTSVERTSNVHDLYKIGSAYEMPSFQVDGMRCEAVHEAVSRAADRARKSPCPQPTSNKRPFNGAFV